MGWFKKNIIEDIKAFDDAIKEVTNSTKDALESEAQEPEEEWIWVEGYKGTDKDMKCRDFQYELDKQYDISEEEVKLCESGFHLCLNLGDVFAYYSIGGSGRYFKVKALVRKIDVEEYGTYQRDYFHLYKNKLVAKSIIFISELTQDEILKDTDVESLEQKYKDLAIECSIPAAINVYNKDILIEDGYSEAFASYITKNRLFDKAHAVGSMPDVSMDMKVLFILQGK